jgi:GNAT superfamily N-acetyltransferase
MKLHESLEDFLNEGTKFDLELKDLTGGDWIVIATKGRVRVGELRFIESRFKPVLKATIVSVDPSHRREGIGSAMYQYAEAQLGKRFVRNEDVLTPDGKALWAAKERKFGQ